MRTWNWIALAALAAGCVIEQQPAQGEGIVEVSWQVGASGCDLSGVTDIIVEVGPSSRTFDCNEGAGSLTVPEGTWSVDLYGLDAGGVERYDASDSATVWPGETTILPTVVLGARPSSLTVTWYFDNGRLCGGNGVEDVEITLFDADYIVDSFETACDDGIEALEGLTAGAFTVSILGRDAQGTARFGGEADVTLDKGTSSKVEIMLGGL